MTARITQWNQRAVIAEVSGRVINGMDKACSFAAEIARGKAPHRTGFLASQIDYEVQPEGMTIVGRVGVRGVGNRGDAFYGYFAELGTKNMAAHPFLRPAVFENGDEIVKLISEG